MNQKKPLLLQFNNSGLGCLVTLLLMGILLGTVGLNWVFNSLLIVLALVLFIPVIAWWGIRWWVQFNLVEDQCPVCDYSFTGFKNTQCQCPNCGETLQVEGSSFQRITPPGTIDVEAIEVNPRFDEYKDE